jgi:DNA-binding MarR family transcriptional regulator
MPSPSPDFDAVLLSPVRLGAISLLATRGPTAFSDLKTLLRVTQGNLGAHLKTLEDAAYVAIDKRFVDGKPRTTAALTPAGRAAFVRHVRQLEEVLHRSRERPEPPAVARPRRRRVSASPRPAP